MNKKFYGLLAIFIVAATVLSACGATPTAMPATAMPAPTTAAATAMPAATANCRHACSKCNYCSGNDCWQDCFIIARDQDCSL